MDNTHVVLFVPNEKRNHRNFEEAIGKAVRKARSFLKEHPEGVPDNEIDAWTAKIDRLVLNSYRNNVSIACAVTGTFYSVISSGLTGHATRRYIGALGQTRLTLALMLLHNADRETLLKQAAISRSLHGARAVARLAAALNAAGATCYLPTAREDADLKIDLLCEYEGRLACIQVKLDNSPESHIATGHDENERVFLEGVAVFNAINGTQAIPLWVSTVSFANISPHTMCSEQSIAFAAQILTLL